MPDYQYFSKPQIQKLNYQTLFGIFHHYKLPDNYHIRNGSSMMGKMSQILKMSLQLLNSMYLNNSQFQSFFCINIKNTKPKLRKAHMQNFKYPSIIVLVNAAYLNFSSRILKYGITRESP